MDDIDNSLYSYFTSKDIKIVNQRFENINYSICLENVKDQINNIINFQSLSKGYTENVLPRIGGSIGRELEGYKVQVKNLQIDLLYRSKKIEKNNVDLFILEEGVNLLSRGKTAIYKAEDSNYEKLIRRSMKNYEICLRNVTETNLRINESGNIEIGTIKYLSYNLIEQDVYSYLKYLRKKNNNIDIESLIYYFVEKSLLGVDSGEYLKALVYYPVESLKIWDKYRKNKRDVTENQYIEGFYKAKKNDGNELIMTGGGL